MDEKIILFYNPRSRARTAHWMLEEVGANYELRGFDWTKEKPKELLEANSMGKIPTILHRGIAVSESAAVCTYLADVFPKAGLAPALDDPNRGPYYRWLFFSANCLEAAITDQTNPRANPVRKSALGYGEFADVMMTIEKAIQDGYLVGGRFTAADLYLSSQLWWGVMSKAITPSPTIERYIKLCTSRPAHLRANEQAEKFKA